MVTDRKAKPVIDGIMTRMLHDTPFPLFSFIEIETINRCNGGCSFCPVNSKDDPRELRIMDEELFRSILVQLGELRYRGTLSLYSNNEPLLDRRLADFAGMARELVPHARLNLLTNGTLLTVPLFQTLMAHLDKMVIDNYSDMLTIHRNVREVMEYWNSNRIPGKRVVLSIRREDAILSSRGGTAPNRRYVSPIRSSCLLPFCQMVVRPDGKLSLCCNDALGSVTLGDLNSETLVDAWNSSRYRDIRHRIRTGRARLDACSRCDAFLGTSQPELNPLPAYFRLGEGAGIDR
jgi:radical SAM protein with 4Fe4S-binding SPASM domain